MWFCGLYPAKRQILLVMSHPCSDKKRRHDEWRLEVRTYSQEIV